MESIVDQNNKLTQASFEGRELVIARQAKKVIDTQKKGESATIIVGNAHVKSIFNQLSEYFPEHVACFSNKHLVGLARNGRVELVKGIEAKRVKPKQEMKDVKTEL